MAALALYVAAKAAELSDRSLFAGTGVLNGHTLNLSWPRSPPRRLSCAWSAAADRAIPQARLQSPGERRRVPGPDGAHRPPPITLK